MKLTCDREKLLHAFQMAASVAPSRSPKPILQNIKLEVASDSAMLIGTDLEVGIRVGISGLTVEAPGDVILPVARFGAILREMTDEKLELESDGQKTVVRGQQAEFQLPSANPDEFPTVSSFEEGHYYEMPARFFREIVRRTVFATENESSRYALGGVLLELSETGIIAVGTDGRRLAKQEGPAESVGERPAEGLTPIVPARAMQLIEKALIDNEENIQLAARDNDILVRSGQTTIYSRLVEGHFPKWRDVFPPRDDVTKIELTVGPFHAAVRQAAIVTSSDRRGVEFRFGGGKLTLSGHGGEDGEAHVEMPIAYDGPDIAIMLDPRYVADFLRVLDPEKTFTMELRNGESAAVGITDDGYGYVIMPLARDQKA